MPITQIAAQMNMLQSGLASAERVFEFLDATEEGADYVPAADQKPRPERAGRVTLENVSFRYEPDKPLIEDFTLDVAPGQSIAIVGPTGAGKTTLVNLLVRFYEFDAGRISLDGTDYAELTRDEVRRAFGMVLQDTWLFAGTIADNIAYGKAGATDEEIVDAATAAYVGHFVRTLPDGYDTRLDADASNFSSGQKQLLTIARAFLASPPIPHPGRSHQQRRHPHRSPHPGSHGSSAARPHQLRHRPPAVHDPKRRHDHRHGRRAHRGARQPCGSAGVPRPGLLALQQPVY